MPKALRLFLSSLVQSHERQRVGEPGTDPIGRKLHSFRACGKSESTFTPTELGHCF